MDYLFIITGLVLLFFGGEALIKGAVSLATRFGLSPMLIGLTIVGFGTSAPELVVSVKAALGGQPDIAIGNVIGSNIANILLILGFALVIMPVRRYPSSIRRDLLVMLAASLLLYGLVYLPVIPRLAGVLMVATLLSYLYYAYRTDSHGPDAAGGAPDEAVSDRPITAALACAFVVGGILGLVGGAHLLVTGAVNIARSYGVSEAVIGLTLVAVGTSLPELATAIVAAIRKHADVVLGNVIGSNIFNVLCIVGVTAIITPIPVDVRFARLDAPIMAAIGVSLLLLTRRRPALGRSVGFVFLAAYVGYTALLFATDTAP